MDINNESASKKIKALIWVISIIDISSTLETVIYSSLGDIINNFTVERLIIVFSRCNQIIEEIDLDNHVRDFINILSVKLRHKMKVYYLFHGITSTEYFDYSKFNIKFIEAIKKILEVKYEEVLIKKFSVAKHLEISTDKVDKFELRVIIENLVKFLVKIEDLMKFKKQEYLLF